MCSSPYHPRLVHVAVVLLALPLGMLATACIAPVSRPATAELIAFSGDPAQQVGAFWKAVRLLELRTAIRIAPDRDHAEFARGIQVLLDGQTRAAEDHFQNLASSAVDSLIQVASRVTLASIFAGAGRWGDLHTLSSMPPPLPRAATEGRASIDLWSAAMRTAPESRYDFSAASVRLPFGTAGTGTPLVRVQINGQARYFWLDTGTSLTLIASDVAARASVEPLTHDTLEIVTTVGRIGAQPAVIDSFEIGPLVAANHPVAIVQAGDLSIRYDFSTGYPQRVKVDGVLGMDLLRRLDIRLDFARGITTLAEPRPNRTGRRERNLFWLGYPVVRLTGPKGIPLFFGLDTGADSTYVTETLLRKLPHRLGAKQTRWIAGFGGDTTIRTPILVELRVNAAGRNVTLRNLIVRDTRRLMFFELDGILASDVSAGHRVRIDMSNGIFTIDSPSQRRTEPDSFPNPFPERPRPLRPDRTLRR